jgi:hypothetical protein
MRISDGLNWVKKLILAAAVPLILAPAPVWAQARPVAVKKADISAFAAFTRVTPDYDAPSNKGFTFGVDVMKPVRWFLKPSLEFRGTIAPGPTVNENTYGGGVKVEHPIWRLHPYADFLVSAGTITFKHPNIDSRGRLYKSDNSIVYTYGGGVDYDLTPRWAAKVDYQGEHWNLGTSQTLTPQVLTIGVVYRIPF